MALRSKLKEAVSAVVPIVGLVLLLHFTIAPIQPSMLWRFGFGSFLVIIGLVLFGAGCDAGVIPIGEMIGAALTLMKKPVILLLGFVIGFAITFAEPDLQVLAKQIEILSDGRVPRMLLVLAVSMGVGLFIAAALYRIITHRPLKTFLLGGYLAIFVLAFFTPPAFLPLSFDSGGVTTGPMTVPFILSLGIGTAAVHGGKTAKEDSFGFVALASIGPIIFVMLLGIIFRNSLDGYPTMPQHVTAFLPTLRSAVREVLTALLPMILTFAAFQAAILRLPVRRFLTLSRGIAWTMIGLVLFLTGVNTGFMPAGMNLGQGIAGLSASWALVPVGMVLGFLVVWVEPAVTVLKQEVERVSEGYIRQNTLLYSLALGVAVAVGLAMVRVMLSFSIWYFVLPGYLLAMLLMKHSPTLFTAIAFDAGGVASGPMSATFIVSFAMGASHAIPGSNPTTEALGTVAMIAMTPLITIQALGILYARRARKAPATLMPAAALQSSLDDDSL